MHGAEGRDVEHDMRLRLAVELAGRIVGESLEDEARQRRTVENFLAELEERSGSTAGARSTS